LPSRTIELTEIQPFFTDISREKSSPYLFLEDKNEKAFPQITDISFRKPASYLFLGAERQELVRLFARKFDTCGQVYAPITKRQGIGACAKLLLEWRLPFLTN
jgi:hypothetical protein